MRGRPCLPATLTRASSAGAVSLALLLAGCGLNEDPPELRNLVAADEVPAPVDAESAFWFGDPVDLSDARRGPVSPPVEARAIVDDPTVAPGSVLLVRLLDGTTRGRSVDR